MSKQNIARITKAYIRKYSDSGQIQAYVEWIDGRGATGRTEGEPCNLHILAPNVRASKSDGRPGESWST